MLQSQQILVVAKRFDEERSFHKQLLAFEPVDDSWDMTSSSYIIGTSVALITGGWEFENCDLSLFDFGKAGVDFSVSPTHIEANAGAAIWAPNVGLDIFNGTLELGLTLGAKVGFSYGKKYGADLGIFSISYVPN